MTSTRIAFLLDRTGSMNPIREDVIGGYNTFLAEQRELEEGPCPYSVTQFDTSGFDTETYDDIKDAPALNLSTYVPRAATNLLDAVARVIGVTENMPDAIRTLVVIYTDGYENASVEITKDGLKKLVDERKDEGWDFIFIGADIDAFGEAGGFGFTKDQSFSTWSSNTNDTFAAVTTTVNEYRSGATYAAASSSLRDEADKQTGGKKDDENAPHAS
jgi:hypothetical protein